MIQKRKKSKAFSQFRSEVKHGKKNLKGNTKYVDSLRHRYYVDVDLYKKVLRKKAENLNL